MSKSFVVLTHKESKEPLDRTVFIEDTFSFIALVLPFLWLIYNRIWLTLFIYVAVSICSSSLQTLGYIGNNSHYIVITFLNVFIAINAHDLVLKKYLQDNYIFQEIILAKNKTNCIKKYITLLQSKN